MKRELEKIRNGIKHKVGNKGLKPEDFVSTGSTLLNLAITGSVDKGFFKGGYFHFVGDSTSGKTFLCMTVLAEAAKRGDFDDYDYIYDGTTENGALMDIRKFFGSKVDRRLQLENSETIEEMYYNLDERLDRGKPFIKIVDSMDGLDSEADKAKFKKQKSAYKRGKEEAGSFGDGKAKKNSQTLRKMLKRLRQTGSILIVIGQTRDKLSMGYGDNRTTGGGRALKFYAQFQLWSSIHSHLIKKVNGKNRELGIISKIQVKKNRIKGRDRTAYVQIYNSYGIDDLGSCIDYLIAEGHWKGTKEKVKAPEFDFSGPKSKLIRQIEKEGSEIELRAIVRKVWQAIEDACSIKRKARYE